MFGNMKIGTWNLNARWSAEHKALMIREACDVWLLTEVSPSVSIFDYHHHFSAKRMSRGQHYSAILSRLPLRALPDPHPASAAVVVGDITFCSTILPWSTCAHDPSSPWSGGGKVEDMVRETVDQISESLPKTNLVWGGDWNQNLVGGWEHVGSINGRARLDETVQKLTLKVPTADLPHQLKGSHTIDHIAVPRQWNCHSAIRVDASSLSDHDAYIVEAEPCHAGNALRSP